MAYLFLSFTDRLNRSSNFKSELYNQSLTEQFEYIQKRIPLDRQTGSFMNFIEACFTTGLIKKYYISCPNFLREKEPSKSGKVQYLDNVVVRPELTLSMKSVLPDNQNIILIGKIVEGGKQKLLEVKGIQLIDSSISSPNDMVISAAACNSFTCENKSSIYGGTFTVNIWSVPNVSYEDTVFTPNFVYDLIQSCWTVSKPEQIRQSYDIWKKYIEFRKYYLQEQSKRNFKLDRTMFVEAYAVNRKEYKKNASIYDEYLLDGLDEFKRGEMIVLSEKVEDAEEFPLIRLDIERNRKAFNEAKINKHGKLVNEEERKIRSLSSDNVFITSIDPKSKSQSKDRNGNQQQVTFSELLNVGYALGDRFKIVSYDIEPIEHLEELDLAYTRDIDKLYKNIDTKYEKIIKDEVKQAINLYEKELNKIAQKQIELYKKELDSSLEQDVLENKDKNIISLIDKKKNEIEANVKNNNKKDKKEKDVEYASRIKVLIDEECSKIDVKSYYVERNSKLLQENANKIEIEIKRQLTQYEAKKNSEITNKYKDDVRNEKIKSKEELDAKLKIDKEKVIEEETIVRFSLYFRLGDPNNVISDKQKKTVDACEYIVYDNRAEKAKILRQEAALDNFYSGYVKNPYLSTYLFNPEELDTIRAEPSDWIWYLDSLNEKQKEAVRKAVSSNGIFLLQGPPGTDKTQVIAEIVAQLIKKGKKVLISSETHKAIDNVFERLPKIAEIVPIRLIPSNNDKKKENEYDPKFLVDNFYLNISSNMKKAVNRYKNFEKNKIEFAENFDKLKLAKIKIEKSQKILDKANEEIKKYEDNAKDINSKISLLNEKKDLVRIDIDILRRTKRHIENDNLRPDEDVKIDLIVDVRKKLEPLFEKNVYIDCDLGQLLKNINSINNDGIERELAVINPESKKIILEVKKNDLKCELNKYVDDIGDIIDPKYEKKVQEIKNELKKVKNEINSESGDESLSNLKLNKIFNYSYLVANISLISEIVRTVKDRIIEIKSSTLDLLNKEIRTVEDKQVELDKEIDLLKQQIKLINENIIDIQERNDVKDIQEAKYKLENDLIKFFKDFEIAEPYKDVDEGLIIIKRKWSELEDDFQAKEQENKEKIPMYEKIANYITSEDVIEEDRKVFTKDLFENANVFGITCTSNDRFSRRNVDALSEYNIDEIDIKSVGIDVVIIDEVSKSSFIDLLIPILYGKTVILVGDHRQLPPMYEFSKLRDDDFDGLDETIINKEINKKFTSLYEECFFKTLFEKIPDSYKTMLVQQYRCHEHIMNVFNHFYKGELKLGFDGQNNNKRHNVRLLSNGRNIIEPDKHIYFVDCKQNETHETDSTSMYNTGEAKVVVELIRKLNAYFKSHSELEKLSIGVICTYGDQARKVKELLKSEKVKTDAFKTDSEKMIVSTVDDFQGDERDIIIFSTVRNPENQKRSDPGFILAYQRINVALSRARRMLVMVGNRKYLEEKGVIDLPDVYGRVGKEQRNFRVYEEILSTIERYGKVIEDIDVLGDKEARING